jgi:hypothetical protein
MRSELSCWQMLLRFSDLFFQKSSSVKGSGWPPDLRAFSGSYLSTFLICFYQWIMAVSRMCALSLDEVRSLEVTSYGGSGRRVRPFTWPMVT